MAPPVRFLHFYRARLDLTRVVTQLRCVTLQERRTSGVLRGLQARMTVRSGCKSRFVTVRFSCCAYFWTVTT